MRDNKRLILTINPGSTSVKLALFLGEECIEKRSMRVDVTDLIKNYATTELDENNIVFQAVNDFIHEINLDVHELDMVVSRAGPTPPIKSGAYEINDFMIKVLKYKPNSRHPAMVGPEIAYRIAKPLNIPAMVYDSSVADEGGEIAHISGLPEIRRNLANHTLNARMMGRKLAEKLGRSYEESNFIVAHLGGGTSIGAHENGIIVDAVFVGEGPMAPTRAGKLPTKELIELCFSGKYTLEEMKNLIMMRGGLKAYFGTDDATEVERMIEDGNEQAKNVYYAMSYQISKNIAELAAVFYGNVDGILLTGGLAHSKMLTGWISERVKFIAPVYIMPGEDEMMALALGGHRVLDQKEPMKEYDTLPKGFNTKEEFYREFNISTEND